MTLFADRRDAGRQLAAQLRSYAERADTCVLALPRGGVPVAAEIARELKLPLDVFIVRKLGAPGQPELAMGAIASGGALVMNPEVREYFADRPDLIDAVIERERQELVRREQAYRTHPPLSVAQKNVIVVDDGAATGATMRAAVQALRARQAARIIVALPVCSPEARALLWQEADAVVCLDAPRFFHAVGEWYQNFEQTTDEEVRARFWAHPAGG